MASKYYDVNSVMQVIGGVFTHPTIIDEEDKYNFISEDFSVEFHRIIFGSIYNLYKLGATHITPILIEDYLSAKPDKLATYKANKGSEYLQKLVEFTQFSAFDYYYKRMKKMTLLRMYYNAGVDVSDYYDDNNILDVKKKQAQEEWLDNTKLDEIADLVDKKITYIRMQYVGDNTDSFIQAGEGIRDLLARLKEHPEVGYPLFGNYINTITNGARLGKLYIRSASTGTGKTRSMIADACTLSCKKLFNQETRQWEDNTVSEPTLFIATEQDEEEVQTMLLAFVAGVGEDKIITSTCSDDEAERLNIAAGIIENSPLYVKKMMDYSMQDIENAVKYAIREWNCHYIFYDYLHSSMKILSEINSRSGVSGLREDNVLFMIAARLKDICNQYRVFIMTATQLNGNFVNAEVLDQNVLRGAKSIADVCDVGMIMVNVTKADQEALKDTLAVGGYEMPQVKISVYKNRRGPYKDIVLWCNADRGVCKINPVFITNNNYELQFINDTKIVVKR